MELLNKLLTGQVHPADLHFSLGNIPPDYFFGRQGSSGYRKVTYTKRISKLHADGIWQDCR
jgi:hypothetical protein